MQHLEGTFKGVRNADIYDQAWLPDGEVKAVILIVHGIGEHSGRYTNHVNYFVPRGYAIYALDHLGHGKSDGEREVIERFSDYTDTLGIFSGMVRESQPGKPVFILGHSMGGLITSTYLLDHQDEFRGAILSAPAIKPGGEISGATIAVGKVISRIMPKLGVLALDDSGISRDPAVLQAYRNDPLVFQGKTPARLGAEMLSAMQRVTDAAATITLPILIVQGTGDTLVDPSGAQLLYDKVGSPDKTLKLYDGLYHELHNEPERDIVFADVDAWLAAHLPAEMAQP
ncbi:MAG: lysophospholipase [Caldilineaceae bacterium]|nr:lysophospholipase [Caldilineaceae bacterium]